MSEKSEQMRPIPDGGLKEAMPSWLKRPPAWRDLPSVEERHERTLPEPDTSTIDPHSLVDVTDLPQWLQAVAAKGKVPAPAADDVAEVVTAAEAVPVEPGTPVENEMLADEENDPAPTDLETGAGADEPSVTALEQPATGMPVWLLPVVLIAILAIAVVLFYFL